VSSTSAKASTRGAHFAASIVTGVNGAGS
jgi:hypothetical protein